MKKIKKILALVCVVLLIGMYIVTFIMALVDSSATMAMFKGCITMTIFVPVVIFCYICLHKYAMTRSGRRDYYSENPSGDNRPSEEADGQ